MPAQILTVRVIDAGGRVTAVRQAPFLVLAEGEDKEQGVRELVALAEQLIAEAEELELARFDPLHRRHHWWQP